MLLKLIQDFSLGPVTFVLRKLTLCSLGLAQSLLSTVSWLDTLVYSDKLIDQLKGRGWCWNVGQGCVTLD